MVLPKANEEYSTKAYWDSRYTHEDPDTSFDWFKSYADLATYIRLFIPDKTARILMLGCGNSKFSEEMWEDGYKNIVNIDYSTVVLERMRARHAQLRPEMEWHEMDVRALTFENSSFDIAIDKGGVIPDDLPLLLYERPARDYGCDDDVLYRRLGLYMPMVLSAYETQSSQSPPEDIVKDCIAEVSEVLRVLRPSGTLLYITFGQPHFRRRFLTGPHCAGTRLEVKELGESFHYYMYVLHKSV